MPLEITDPSDAKLTLGDEDLGTVKVTIIDHSEFPYMHVTKDEALQIISHLQEQFKLKTNNMKYKKGDIVTIKCNLHGHSFNVGEKVKVIEVNGRDEHYRCEVVDSSDRKSAPFVNDEELE